MTDIQKQTKLATKEQLRLAELLLQPGRNLLSTIDDAASQKRLKKVYIFNIIWIMQIFRLLSLQTVQHPLLKLLLLTVRVVLKRQLLCCWINQMSLFYGVTKVQKSAIVRVRHWQGIREQGQQLVSKSSNLNQQL